MEHTAAGGNAGAFPRDTVMTHAESELYRVIVPLAGWTRQDHMWRIEFAVGLEPETALVVSLEWECGADNPRVRRAHLWARDHYGFWIRGAKLDKDALTLVL